MTHDALRERIAAFTALDAPTGYEEPVLARARDELQQTCDHVEVDVRGNVYGWQGGTSDAAPRVMITAHADEIGFLVTAILPGGFLRFTKLGGPTDMVLPGQRVRVLSNSGALPGVIGVKPGHVLTPGEARQTPAIPDMYIDVGASSPEEVEDWGIEVGTPAVFVGELTPTRNSNRCFGKCVDNRMGVVSVLATAERMQNRPIAATRVYVIVVEEEVGLRGAHVAAAYAEPDVVLAIDTTPAGGTPDLRGDQLPWGIGAGPLLKVRETRGLSTHGPLLSLIRETADEHGVPYQLIVDTAGMTDATSAQQASARIAAAVIGLARRYSHSAVEMFDLSDVQAIIDLTVQTTERLTDRAQLLRI